MNMSEWAILQIEETSDRNLVRKAYAALIKKYKPHEQPEMFKKIRAAYEHVINLIEGNLIPREENSSVESHDIDCNPIDHTLNSVSLENQEYGSKDLIKLYEDLDTRNDIEIWRTALQANSTALLMSDEAFNTVMEYIIKSEYLYPSSLALKPEIYLLIFDFFNIDEVSCISYFYSKYVSGPLLDMLYRYREEKRLSSIQENDFNMHCPEAQIAAEDYFHTQIYDSVGQLVVNIEQLKQYLESATPTYFKVLRNVVFKDLLERQLSAIMQSDALLAAHFYLLFKFKNNTRNFYKVFEEMNYSKEDIKKCLTFTKEAYILHLRSSFWERIIKVPFRKGLFFWYAIFIFAVIRGLIDLILYYN